MPRTFPMRSGFIAIVVVFAAASVLFVTGNGHDGSDRVRQIGAPEFLPDVTCEADACRVRVAAVVGDRRVLSEPLPFFASSGEVQSIPPDASFGVGDTKGRALSAWSIGREEHSIGVALEPLTIRDGAGVIAHQTAGFDHVKRVHVVLQFDGNVFKKHFEITEGAGPEVISLWPEPAGIAVGRRTGDESVSIERYLWDGEGSALSLIPLN